MNLYLIGFWVLSVITVVASILVVYNRNPIVSALFLALSFIGASGLFILLDAHFLAFIQILIYAGAIVVLFIYVIMLLDLSPKRVKGTYGLVIKVAGAVLFVCILFVFIFSFIGIRGWVFPALAKDYPTIIALADQLFLVYVVPFELVSVILMIGIIGGVLLVKRVEKKG